MLQNKLKPISFIFALMPVLPSTVNFMPYSSQTIWFIFKAPISAILAPASYILEIKARFLALAEAWIIDVISSIERISSGSFGFNFFLFVFTEDANSGVFWKKSNFLSVVLYEMRVSILLFVFSPLNSGLTNARKILSPNCAATGATCPKTIIIRYRS